MVMKNDTSNGKFEPRRESQTSVAGMTLDGPVVQAAEPVEGEMLVVIRPLDLPYWKYQGTRAQLEAEGVIPAKTEWPEGVQERHWVDGRFRWELRRTRPAGLRGPMKLWTSGDWWSLRCLSLNGPDWPAQLILDKERELAEEIYRQSAAGRREWERYMDTLDDKAFQAFKSKIRALAPQRKPRKTSPKGETNE